MGSWLDGVLVVFLVFLVLVLGVFGNLLSYQMRAFWVRVVAMETMVTMVMGSKGIWDFRGLALRGEAKFREKSDKGRLI